MRERRQENQKIVKEDDKDVGVNKERYDRRVSEGRKGRDGSKLQEEVNDFSKEREEGIGENSEKGEEKQKQDMIEEDCKVKKKETKLKGKMSKKEN